MRKILIGVSAISLLALLGVATAPAAIAKTHRVKAAKIAVHDPVIYDSIIDPNPGNVPSMSYEGDGVQELGNQINFDTTSRVLSSVVVQMSSWACQSGSWTGSPSPCVTAPGATFSVPITFNIFGVGPASANGPSTTGALLATDTQTFAIPYRPSADPTDCPSTPTTWYDAGLAKCFNGYFTDIEFTFGHVTLPSNVIYGITFNTNTSGFSPLGHTGPTDSLNVALSNEPKSPSVGSDSYPGTLYMAVHGGGYQSNYCDGGAAGIGVFRIDEPAGYPTNNGTNSGCWGSGTAASPWYIPAVQFNAVNNSAPSITSLATGAVVAGTPFSFAITTTGVPAPTITVTRLPKGLNVVKNGNGTATIFGTALRTDKNKTYVVLVRAKNFRRNSVAKQRLLLTLTGGR
ncbi:MAG TPA: hypothetical protein VMU64_12925 [Acidimicrobiales bacterium]|nr:hypothetical protein [Acidimicrobiales bacterium]